MPPSLRLAALTLAALAAYSLAGCRQVTTDADATPTDSPSPYTTTSVHATTDVDAGRYLIVVGGCNDCHTPGWMEQGPNVPESQWLVGSPIGFRGPWGTSYPKNLRLTAQQRNEDQWVARLRETGLPPMPWMNVNALTEQDARVIYRYIRSLGPAGEMAPTPVPPTEEPTTPYFDFVPRHLERLSGPSAPNSSAL